MSADDVLQAVERAGIHLWAEGDSLKYNAPAGALTPELRDALTRHKVAILATLAPARGFVTLRPDARSGFAPTVPVEAVELAISLEARGLRQSVDEAGAYQVEPGAQLTEADRVAIARWRLHLGAIISYEAPEIA